MPDESLQDLERLMNEAAAQATQNVTATDPISALAASTEASLQHDANSSIGIPGMPKPCPSEHSLQFKTLGVDYRVCRVCLWPFCNDCASTLDPDYCHLCLSEGDAGVRVLPLVDVDGHEVEGRRLQPGPKFETLTKRISDMSDNELEDFVSKYKALIQQAEKALDFRRVVLATSQMEQAQRGDVKRRALRADKTRYAVKTVTVDKTTGKQVKKTASMGDMTRMLQMLEALNKLKQAKSPATPAIPKVPNVKTP